MSITSLLYREIESIMLTEIILDELLEDDKPKDDVRVYYYSYSGYTQNSIMVWAAFQTIKGVPVSTSRLGFITHL